jgi:transcriptional regulator of acetoin/glycerol metabolism/AraC-like DNA-binding protein
MGSLLRLSRAIDIRAWHTEQVYSVAASTRTTWDGGEVAESWCRSVNAYGVDPDSGEAPRILTAHELGELRRPIDRLISSAQDEIDRLYKLVRDAGYTLLLCDTTGVAIEHRGEEADADLFKYWGTWLGGVWSEAIEGTNGIGTCIAEERPITVHRAQHFRSRHIDLSCSAAPLFNIDGSLMAVLDVSAVDPERSDRAHGLTGALTLAAARAIEERFFRERFRREWILAMAPPQSDGTGMLFAVDSHQRIVGANRAARVSLLLDDPQLQSGISLWAFFERDAQLFRHTDTSDIPTRLIIAGSDETWPALVTPPERPSGTWQSAATAALHAHPRLDQLAALRRAETPPQARGGLSPGAARRVRDHVEAHLSENIDLAGLAAIAGLSVYHFARAFKQSTGLTPHQYLVRQRLERAKEMLTRTEGSLAEIALAAGFADQSHLGRHFRQILGVTPSQFRWSQR